MEPPKVLPIAAEHAGSKEWRHRSPSLSDLEVIELMEDVKITKIVKCKCPNLNDMFPDKAVLFQNVKKDIKDTEENFSGGYSNYIEEDDVIISDIVRDRDTRPQALAYQRAGPRQFTYFDPTKVAAGIVTCGGIVPGMNNVIRDLVKSMRELYGVETIYGFKGGFRGMYSFEPILLTNETVSGIHLKGGTILNTSADGCNPILILQKLKALNVNQLYIIGGDGAMRGAFEIYQASIEEANETGYILSVVGIPKSIDNDIGIIDSSFGFRTAVTEALNAIISAKTEARCVPDGVGLVKLLGKECGYIAAQACLASGFCDLCLIPEVPVQLKGPNNHLEHLAKVIRKKGHAVVVISSGAYPAEERPIKDKKDSVESNSDQDSDIEEDEEDWIGGRLKEVITEYCANLPEPIYTSVKYIDPSYMIRSVEANAADSMYCFLLAQNAVHAAMSGLTAFCVGRVNNRICYIPMISIIKNSPRRVDVRGRMFERVLMTTGQPRFADYSNLENVNSKLVI